MHEFSIMPTIEMEQVICGSCGALFALPSKLLEEKRTSGGNFHCPNGHSRVFIDTKVDRLKIERRQLLEQVGDLRTELRKANREIKKLKKPKKKKRKGV